MQHQKALVGFTVDTFHGFSSAEILKHFKILGVKFIEFTVNLLKDFDKAKINPGNIKTAFHLPIIHVDGWDFSCTQNRAQIKQTIDLFKAYHHDLKVQHIVAHPPECSRNRNDEAGVQLWLESISRLPARIYIENVHHVPMDTFFTLYNRAKSELSNIAGMCFDVAHAYLAGLDPIEEFRLLKDDIGCVHLSDCTPKIDKHLPFACGGVLPIQKFLAELGDFQGSITLEIKPPSFHEIPATIQSYLQTLKTVRKDMYYYSAVWFKLIEPLLKYRIHQLAKTETKTKRG